MNANLLDYIILTAVAAGSAAFMGTFGWGLSQTVSPGIKNGIRNMARRVVLGIRRPFSWSATEIREWRRVSTYRHRHITWDDLPKESKDSVRFLDLSENARDSVKMHQLPQDEKYKLLDKFILPKLRGATFEGTLHLLNDEGSTTLFESARLTLPPVEHPGVIDRDGMQLTLLIIFENPENEIALPRGGKIGFEAKAWRMIGNIRTRQRISPGSQNVEIWITYLQFDGIPVFGGAD